MTIENVVNALKDLFIVRRDCYPLQIEHKNEYIVVKENLTYKIISDHLKGLITIGCWQVDPLSKTVKWVCFDFDGVIEEEFEKAKKLFYKLKNKGLNPLMEFSGRRGYHIWLFVEPIDLIDARKFAIDVSRTQSPHEIFPKNDKLTGKGYGFQVKLPLGIHRVPMKRSFLFDENLRPLSHEKSQDFLIKLSRKKRDTISSKNLISFVGS
ncbi:MAG: hypothetical protein HYZ54_07250 [Ignavibacteriae bacterium]|nr:hypothetical protein [Ignavibacteriota bacterium]